MTRPTLNELKAMPSEELQSVQGFHARILGQNRFGPVSLRFFYPECRGEQMVQIGYETDCGIRTYQEHFEALEWSR